MQKLAQSTVGTTDKGPEVVVSDQFPAGLRVLVVDDDVTCLRILERMLLNCLYHVTPCTQATVALSLLRERKGSFDVVLSDVHMPDMDGYKLLEHVGLEMDLPVIMISADGRTSAVMKGIRHGACDYLIKPIREEELKNIWQHVVRKKWNENKELEHSGSLEDNDRHKLGNDDAEYASSVTEGTEGALKHHKKRTNPKDDDDGELENDDPSTSKKPRVVWSVELHQQFVSAVNQLGIDKAVPKRILELMNVPGLTRENVASHLQKFRLYLKRISGVAQQGGISNTFGRPVEPNGKISSLGRFDIQALAASGQIPPQTLSALHAELLGRPTGNLVAAIEQPDLLQASLQGPKSIPADHGVAFGQALVKCQSNIAKHFPQSNISVEEIPSGFGAWQSNSIGAVGTTGNLGGLSSHNSNLLIELVQQQQRQQQQQSTLLEPSRSISVQPSCLVVPSHSSASFQAGNSPASVNQNSSFTGMGIIDYGFLSSQTSNGQLSNGNIKTKGVNNGYAAPSPVSPSVSTCSVNAESCTTQQVQNQSIAFKLVDQFPGLVQNNCNAQVSYVTAKSSEAFDQGLIENLGFVGQGASIPSIFAFDEFQSTFSSSNHGKMFAENNVNRVKREPDMDFMDNAKVGMPML
ncbi:hypothetical protein SLEP1_g22487 [Rubroshorea leprosula]|uniref:Two-component response regulator n=1 Tax=Rubroshorea leprosula TaxID=152421 RepID=A0AAV5JJU8_9ROSI|nr:hypothetical protein SLEP1_g22487 [Rubroshorea leprosula]